MIILSGTIQTVHGLMQLKGYVMTYNSNFIITGNFSNPGSYCGFLAVIFVICFGILLFRKNINEFIKKEYFHRSPIINSTIIITSIVTIILISVVFIYINSSASFMSILLGCVSMIFSKKKYLKTIKIKVLTGLSIFLLLIGFFYFLTWNNRSDSANGRILIWKVTNEMIKDNLLTGVGFDNFTAFYMDSQANYFQENKGTKNEQQLSDDVCYAFNEFLQYMAENGVIGVCLLIITVIFYCQTRTINIFLKLLINGILVSIIVFASFSYPSHILPIKIILIFCLALISHDSKTFSCEISLKIFSNNNKRFINILIIAFTILFCHKICLSLNRLKTSYKLWNNAMIDYNNANFRQSKANFESALPILKQNGDFLMNYGKTCTLINENKKALYVLANAKKYLTNSVIEIALGNAYKELGNYKKAEESYRQAAFMIPNRFYPLYLLAKLYEETGQVRKAKQIANEILNKEIKINSTAIEEIKNEMNEILEK